MFKLFTKVVDQLATFGLYSPQSRPLWRTLVLSKTPRIAVISAVTAAIAPAASALNTEISGAELWNVIDDRLMADARAHGIRAEERDRMARLIDHVVRGGAAAVLVTCSLYSGVVKELAHHLDVPVLSADDSAFSSIAKHGFETIVLVAPVAEALADSTERLRSALPAGAAMKIVGVVAENAHAASAESVEALAELIIAVTASARVGADAIFLAQYSLAPAASTVAEATGLPVITTPGSAAKELAGWLSREQVRA